MPPAKRSLLRRRRHGTLGTVPGTVTSDPGGRAPTLYVIAYGPDALEERQVKDPNELAPLLSRYPVVWLDVDGLGDASIIEAVGKVFQLHALALEDVVNVHQRPKAESFRDYEFVVAQMFNEQSIRQQEQLSLFFGKNFIVTFQERPGDCFDPIRDRLRKKQGSARQLGPDYLAYILMDGLIDSYFPILEQYGDHLDQLEDRSLVGHSASLPELHRMKRELFVFRRAVWPLRDAMNALMRDGGSLLGDETRLHLRDLYDHIVQLIDLLETYRELSSDLIELHLSTTGNRMNEVMRVLTIIATIFIPMTFIASIYGMNFKYLPELQWRWGYFWALGLMGAMAFTMLFWFWRRGWLRSFFPAGLHRPPQEPPASSKPGVDPAKSG
jgi:magnesium transporter